MQTSSCANHSFEEPQWKGRKAVAQSRPNPFPDPAPVVRTENHKKSDKHRAASKKDPDLVAYAIWISVMPGDTASIAEQGRLTPFVPLGCTVHWLWVSTSACGPTTTLSICLRFSRNTHSFKSEMRGNTYPKTKLWTCCTENGP